MLVSKKWFNSYLLYITSIELVGDVDPLLDMSLYDSAIQAIEGHASDLPGLNRSRFCDMIWAKKGPDYGQKEVFT